MDEDNIIDVINEFFSKTREMYGDAVEKIWFYDGETCPCCNKRKIDALNMGKESALSLNAFMYHDLNTLIGYFLCSRCVTDLLGNTAKQKSMYANLEQNLKDGYHDHLKSSAS